MSETFLTFKRVKPNVAADLESYMGIYRQEKQGSENVLKRFSYEKEESVDGIATLRLNPSALSRTHHPLTRNQNITTDNTSIYSTSPPTPDVISGLSEEEYER